MCACVCVDLKLQHKRCITKRMNRRSEGQGGIRRGAFERKTGLQRIPATSRINKKTCLQLSCTCERAHISVCGKTSGVYLTPVSLSQPNTAAALRLSWVHTDFRSVLDRSTCLSAILPQARSPRVTNSLSF